MTEEIKNQNLDEMVDDLIASSEGLIGLDFDSETRAAYGEAFSTIVKEYFPNYQTSYWGKE